MIIIALLVYLASCSVTSDPRGGGLLGGIRGIYGGDYENRVQHLQDQLSEEQRNKHNLQEKSNSLKDEERSQDQALAYSQQRNIKLNNDLLRLESCVKQLQANSDFKKKAVANLTLKIKDLKKRLKSQEAATNELDRHGGSKDNLERYRILQSERERLSEEYKMLFEYSQALSEANS